MGPLAVDNSETFFATRPDPLAKDKVLDLGRPYNRLPIAQYFGNKFVLAFSLTNPHFNRLIRGVANQQFIAIHLHLFDAHAVGMAAAGPSDNFSQRAPVQATIQGSDFLNELDQAGAVILEKIMVGHDQAGLAQENVEGKVLHTVERVPSRENRKAAVCHDGDFPNIPDSRVGILGVHGNQFGVDCREETIAFENFRTCRRENALREDHDGIVVDASPRLMISHSGMGQPGSGMKDAKRSRSKLTRGH